MANTLYPINNRKASYGDLSHLSPVMDKTTYDLLPYAVENILHLDNIGNLKEGISLHYNLNGSYGDFPLEMDIDDMNFDKGYSLVDIDDNTQTPEMYNINVDKETVFDIQLYYPLPKTISLKINDELFYYADTYKYPLKEIEYDGSDSGFISEMNNNNFTPNYISYNGYKQTCIIYRVDSYITDTKQPTPIIISSNSPIAMAPNRKSIENYATTIKKIKNTDPKVNNDEIGYGVMLGPSQKNTTPYILYYKFSILLRLTGQKFIGNYLQLPSLLTITISYSQSNNSDQRSWCKFCRCGVGGTQIPYSIDTKNIYVADQMYNYTYDTTETKGHDYTLFSTHDNDIIYVWTTMQTEFHSDDGKKRTYLNTTRWGGHFTHKIKISIGSYVLCNAPIASSSNYNYSSCTSDSILANYDQCAVNSNLTTDLSVELIKNILSGFSLFNNAMMPITEYDNSLPIYTKNTVQCYYKDYTYGKLTIRHCLINYSCPNNIVYDDTTDHQRKYNNTDKWELD